MRTTTQDAVRKTYYGGTHRTCSPEDTIERVRGLLPAMGITRIANVTGLDRIGIPVVMVTRPNARSLAVAQGKGLTLYTAKASGLMEAIESYHGEHITLPLKIATYEELRYTHSVVDPTTLSRLSTSFYHPHLQLAWIEGRGLISGQPCWVPYEIVHTNFTLPMPAGSGSFVMSSNGAASGNHLLEAISHGICEVVERDCTTLWHLLDRREQAQTLVDLQTVEDTGCREILDKYKRADIVVAVWETTTDIGIPSFLCTILDRDQTVLRRSYSSSGMGCHPSREIALFRAVTEAAQSRLTLIAGSRDDIDRTKHKRASDPDALKYNVEEIQRHPPRRSFQEAPTRSFGTFEEDVAWELDRLEACGFARVIMVDLTRPEFRIPVVRIIIPGLEGSHKDAGYVPGPRARARMEGRS